MSGTSLDGVDAALVRITGAGLETNVELLSFLTLPMSVGLKKRLLQAMRDGSSTPLLSSLHFELGEWFAEAVLAVCDQAAIGIEDIDFIGSHGQTIYHQPIASDSLVRSTLQLGEPSVIAYRTRTQVVSNFRSMDLVAGGEGAPLVPYTEYLLYRHKEKGRLLQNIGGIGNVTVLVKNPSPVDIYAFDTGPGNMVIDGLCQRLEGVPFDKDGAIAKRGSVHFDLVERWLEEEQEYFAKRPPKSTGREKFGAQYVEHLISAHTSLSNEDLIATATYFTAKTIVDAYESFVFPHHEIDEIILGGGGSYNPTLVGMIASLLPSYKVFIQEDIGFSSEAKEAIAFALLANETLHGIPSNIPSATGAERAVILGSITPKPF